MELLLTENPPQKTAQLYRPHGRANRAFVDGHLESEDMRKPFAQRTRNSTFGMRIINPIVIGSPIEWR